MPETSSGETVYATPDELEEYVQSNAETLGLSEDQPADENDPDGPSEWRRFLEKIQIKAKARIDTFCRRDFEEHTDDTLVESGEDGTSMIQLVGPVHEVHEVRVDGTVVDDSTYHCKESGALVRTGGSPGRADPPTSTGTGVTHSYAGYRSGQPRDRYEHHSPTWPAGYGNIEISLDWGYALPPEDIVQAEMELVDNVLAGLVQKREGTVVQADNFEVEVSIPSAMTSEIKETLRKHRTMGVTN